MLKWVFLTLAGLCILATPDTPGMGGVAAGLLVSFTLLHLYDRWRDRGSAPSDSQEKHG